MSARRLFPRLALSSRRRAGLAAWAGLVLLALDIFLGTAIPVAQAARQDRLIPIADLAVCTMDGMLAQADPDGGAPAPSSVFCSACLPLVQMLAPPSAPAIAQPDAIAVVLLTSTAHPWSQQTWALGFSARAPPISV